MSSKSSPLDRSRGSDSGSTRSEEEPQSEMVASRTPAQALLASKYCFFGILAFLDDACLVRTRYLKGLSQRFRALADSKEEEAFGMCQKWAKIFDLREYRQLEKLDFISLADFKCGIKIPSTLFIRLISFLRPYKHLKLEFTFCIDWKKMSTA
jgi:hypothetical protein